MSSIILPLVQYSLIYFLCITSLLSRRRYLIPRRHWNFSMRISNHQVIKMELLLWNIFTRLINWYTYHSYYWWENLQRWSKLLCIFENNYCGRDYCYLFWNRSHILSEIIIYKKTTQKWYNLNWEDIIFHLISLVSR